MLTIADLLHFYNSLIVRALDHNEPLDRLNYLIARRNALLDQLRLRDDPV